MKFSFVVLLSIVFLFLPAGARAEKPNLVLVQVDDLAPGLLRTPLRDGKPAMPFLEKSIDSGTFFSSAHNSTPLCSPSRAALLSGQFSHNNHIVGNSGTNGGWDGWQQSPALRENLATLLQGEGYLTAHLGKWTNHYDDRAETPLRTPPGWDIWYSDVREASRGGFYGYRQFMRHPRLGIFDQLSPLSATLIIRRLAV